MTEAFFLLPVFGKYPFFIISYRYPRVESLPYPKYMVPLFTRNPFKIAPAFWIVLRAFWRERPTVVISTGSEVAIPVFLAAKLFRVKTVFIETIVAFEKPSLTGRLLYPLADKFYVQNPETLKAYGRKAEYHGGIV
jgi:UDP-N-acetylglucosamine:LPS N-acetylglucosamine transferase